MIVYLPAALFVVAGLATYGSAGIRRQAATLVMLVAAAWALVLLLNPTVLPLMIGPLLATLLLSRPAGRMPSTFEVLSRRALTIGALVVLVLVLASQVPVGENPLLLTVVPWLLGAVGAAWVLSPIDAREHLQGQVLMVAATAALVVVAVPAGRWTAAAAGAMAIMPVIAARWSARARATSLLSSLALALAALAAALALTGIAVARPNTADLAISFSGPVLLGVALVLTAAVLASPLGTEWAGLLAVVALVAMAPALRWGAVAALVAVATVTEKNGERPAWVALAAFAAVPVLEALAPPLWSARVQTVALATGLVLILYAARDRLLRAVILPAAGLLVLLAMPSLSNGNLTRFQWIAAIGGLLLVARALLLRRDATVQTSIREPLIMGLLLLAISARDGLGLGAVAAVLLLVDLALIRMQTPATGPAVAMQRLLELAGSSWPPSITFGGASLAVIAALQASLALGLLAALMLACLQLAPLLDRQAVSPAGERTPSRWAWLAPALSLLCGVAPAVVLRMLRL